MEFSKEQQMTILHKEGPALVLAGPGSGKTRVIIHRIACLLEDCPTARIISLTFSRAAAHEMQQRFNFMLQRKASNVQFSTLHSLGYKIVQKAYGQNSPQLLVAKQESLLKKIHEEINHKEISRNEAETLVSAISRYKNNNESHLAKDGFQIKNFKTIYQSYETYKRANNLIDYDDMIFLANHILSSNPTQLNYWASLYDYIQVDEAQDLTTVQFNILYHLAPHQNIFAVADDDQNIYGFRGANLDCLLNFTEKNKNCVKFHLNNNYRSTPNIVDFSASLIATNTHRFAKEPISMLENIGKIEILHSKDTYSQASFIADFIEKHTAVKNIGVLYRNNNSSLSIVAALISNDFSFTLPHNFCPVKKYYVNRFWLEYIRIANRIKTPIKVWRKITESNFKEKCIRSNNLFNANTESIDISIDFMKTICSLARSHEEVKELTEKVFTAYSSGNHKGTKSQECEIFLTTIHSAKGLEYDTVFIIDLNKDEFPGKSSISGILLEEERRLFYVAVTRAKNNLFLMYPENFATLSREESIFIKESRAVMKGV